MIGGLRSPALALLALAACACKAQEAADARPARTQQATLFNAAAASQAEIPPLTGRVVDRADILSEATEARLSQISADLEQRTTDQLVVVTLPDLQGRSIEDVGLTLGNAWGIGQRDKDNGVLLIVAPNERKVRIQVGYGLEPILTNERASAIIDEQILPAFRVRHMEEGSVSGAQAIADRLISEAATPRVGHPR